MGVSLLLTLCRHGAALPASSAHSGHGTATVDSLDHLCLAAMGRGLKGPRSGYSQVSNERSMLPIL